MYELPALLVAVLLPFLAAPLSIPLYRRYGEKTGYYAALVAVVSVLCVVWLDVSGASGVYTVSWIDGELGYNASLSFLVDGLSLLMGYIAAGMGVLIMVYARGYMHGEGRQGVFYMYMLAFMGSMLGVVFVENLIALFVFWELTSLASFALIGFYTDDFESVYGARKSLVITVSGGLFMLAGFLLLHHITGTFSIAGMSGENLGAHSLYLPALLLVLLGAATKSAQFPFHIWLPNAMEAPTPVSAFLHSATMVKAGVYLVGRLSPVFSGTDAWVAVVGLLGLLTMAIGALLAVSATDIKELLAYSTVSHLGLITAGFGFAGEIGASAGTFHILNHASFKAALFMVAGIVAHQAGTRRLDELGGFLRHTPFLGVLAAVASLSMAGVPPFNGFYSKELFFEASLHASQVFEWGFLFPVLAVFASVFTFVYSIRFFNEVFLGEPLEEGHGIETASLVPVAVLVGVILIISVVPGTTSFVVGGAASSVFGGVAHFDPHLPTSFTPAFLMSVTALTLGALVYLRYRLLRDWLRWMYRSAPRATADYYYDSGLQALERLSEFGVPQLDTGYLRSYVSLVLTSTSALVLVGYIYGDIEFILEGGVELGTAVPLFAVLAVTVAAGVAVPFTRSHIEGVLMLSIVGFMIGIFYVIVAAPDLAITQIVVETITLVVFLVVLERLPAFYMESRSVLRKGRDLLIAGVVGVTVFVSVLVARSGDPNKIARFLVENSVPEGGGHNIVNVILVDFRAFDTLGEITVVGMAAIGVLTLMAMREVGET